MVQLLDTLLQDPPWATALTHGAIKIITDSQVAARDVARMHGAAPVFAQVLDLYTLAASHDVELQVEWRPREHPLLQHADALSKAYDAGDWSIAPTALERALRQLHCPAPSVDWFAAPWNARAPRFVSRFAAPGAWRVDAFDHCWRLPQNQLALICPPHTIIPRVLAKLEADRADCILILPAWFAAWNGTLPLLPIARQCSILATAIQWGPFAPPPSERCAALQAGLRAYLVLFAS